jgi:hypothetical protein
MSDTKEFAQFDKISFVRDYEAISIPSGTRITIKQGTTGSISQALGDHLTIHLASGALVWVPKRDSAVLAKS